MKNNILSILAVTLLTAVVYSCSQDMTEDITPTPDNSKIKMAFTFSHPSQSRATETSFENGDKVGVYVTESNLPLEIAGNTVNNERLTFDGSSWNASRQLYWDNGSYNAYAYYPYNSEITSITDLDFEVKTDQSVDGTDMELSPYEQSDFLFASARNLTSSADPVKLTFSHIMSKLTVRLIKGEDYEGDIPDNATIIIHNTVPQATIDIQAGVATKYTKGTVKTITARKAGPTSYSAIIVPQRLDNRVPLIEVIVNGVSFLYESRFVFKPGIHHLVNLVLDKNPDQVKIEIGGEITNWN